MGLVSPVKGGGRLDKKRAIFFYRRAINNQLRTGADKGTPTV